MSFAPTDEQQRAVRQFSTGEPLKISAFAGTGKTSTLRLLAGSRKKPGLYIAFNRSIAREAKEKFPRTVDCRTTHSLAFRPIAGQYKFTSGKMKTPLNVRKLADDADLKDRTFGRIRLNRFKLAYLALGTVRRYCQSDALAMSPEHIPQYSRLAGAQPGELEEIKGFTLQLAGTLWKRMTDPRDQMPLGHDGYLKLWALQQPKLAADYILLDEAQDTNGVVLGVLALQQAQMVYVGDRHQQIYEWRGAINAMEKIEGCRETFLTQSFRFGPTIAAAASSVISALGETRQLQGNTNVKSVIGPLVTPDAILARTNVGVMSEVIDALDRGQSPHVVGGVDDLKRMIKDVIALKNKEPAESPELFGFDSWAEVLEAVQEEEDESLRTFVQLVERFGELRLLWAMGRVTRYENQAGVIISTAHKAKGREWDSVRLSQDFASSRPDRPATLDDAECRLFYVAMTRAKRHLDVSPETLAAFANRRPLAAARHPVQQTRPPNEVRTVPPPLPAPRATPRPTPPQLPLSPPPLPPPARAPRGFFGKIVDMLRGS
jgi:hypothetical protein